MRRQPGSDLPLLVETWASLAEIIGRLGPHKSIPSCRSSCMNAVLCRDYRSGVEKDIRADRRKPVQLLGKGCRIPDEHRDVIIRILSRIAPRSRAKQHYPLSAGSIQLVERRAKAPQDWVIGD
jgi:hypothetical protein